MNPHTNIHYSSAPAPVPPIAKPDAAQQQQPPGPPLSPAAQQGSLLPCLPVLAQPAPVALPSTAWQGQSQVKTKNAEMCLLGMYPLCGRSRAGSITLLLHCSPTIKFWLGSFLMEASASRCEAGPKVPSKARAEQTRATQQRCSPPFRPSPSYALALTDNPHYIIMSSIRCAHTACVIDVLDV
eukprot:1138877-Pelagomonas_calceolata.AAC.8